MSIKRDREALIADARSRAESLRRMFPNDGEAWDDARLIEGLADALEDSAPPTPQVTDEMVAAALDARAGMSRTHIYLYATEKCWCGAEWSDSHWMRFVLEAALEVNEQ